MSIIFTTVCCWVACEFYTRDHVNSTTIPYFVFFNQKSNKQKKVAKYDVE